MREAIDSALAQTYKDLEILVINDGSPDGGATDKIAKSYGDRIRYIAKENGGVSTVLNLALREMKGEYFSWLSHDDVYYPEKIQEEVDYLIQNKLIGEKVILYSDYDLIDENGKLISKAIKDHKMLEEKPEYALLRGTVNGITLLIPKIAFDECGNFDESLRCAQDYELWYRMMKKGYSYVHIPKILAKSRFHSKQVSNTNPKVETEGNSFWINMIDDISLKTKIKLEGSEYNYYLQMEKFLKDTPYHIAEEHCRKKYKKIENDAKPSIKDIKVSVIIPFYNRSKLVIRAIKSVLKQTHKNYEIIVINDGSTDDITEVKNIAKQNKNVKLINVRPNKGAANARNVGIDNATGSYVAFLDSDDVFEPKKLEVQLLQMVITNSLVSHTSYYRKGFNQTTLFNSGRQTGNMIPTLIWSCQIATPTIMINKNFLDKNNFRFNTELIIGEDTCFWITILMHEKLLGIDIPLTTVYSNENSAAYNVEKQIIGMKTILRFVLNQPELEKYDYETAMLARYYVNFVNQLKNSDDLKLDEPSYLPCANCEAIMNSKSWKMTKPLRWMSLFLRSLKRNGIKITMQKTYKRIENKMRGQ